MICNQDQRQKYKQDFNKEYKDYLDLHSRIDCVTRQFTELDTQLKQLRHGTHKYQVIHRHTRGVEQNQQEEVPSWYGTLI